MSSEVKKFGKIVYVEPNDILENMLLNKTDNETYNLTNDYSDYSLSVDLTVTVPSRYGFASNKKGNISTEIVKNEGTVSFFSGTNGFLNDNVTSITYKDILNNENTRESLGITNIHITYNSYFYPEVTMNFTDVRGAALMMPHEENYMREQTGKSEKVKSFFTSLFSFPYPEFKLSVKGFYGKKVEYSLLVVDFKSAFNNSTGNFDATVKFIGKMYGLYTDIPMSYLLLAPFCNYGSTNGKTIWQNHNFRFDDGSEMPTLIDLKKKMLTLNSEIEVQPISESSEDLKNIGNKMNILQELNSEFAKFKVFLSEKDGVIVKDNVVMCKPLRTFMGNTVLTAVGDSMADYSCDYLYEGSNELYTITKKIYELVKTYNTNAGSNVLSYITNLTKPDSKIGEGKPVFITKKNENEVTVSSGDKKVTIKNKYPNLNNALYNYLLDNKKEIEEMFIYDGSKLHDEINSEIKKLIKESERLKNDASEKVNVAIANLLGFKPSVRNVFKILLAHLQTFLEIFNNFIEKTTLTNQRELSKFGLDLKIANDIKSKSNDKSVVLLPPFPSLKDTDKNEYVYPTPDIIKGVMEETVLIDELFDGTVKLNKTLDEINRLESQYQSEESLLIPTCLTDLLNVSNPYSTVFKNGDGGVDWIFTYFGIRCISKIGFERLGLMSAESFGKCEAYNFWRVNKDLKRTIIENIESNDCNAENFIKFLSGNKENNPYIINNIPCYKDNDSTSCLISGTTVSPNFNTPAIIGRGGGNIKTYYSDIEDEDNKYAFKSGLVEKKINDDLTINNRPLCFIDFVDKNVLEEWNSKINELNLESYCTEEIKKSFIENYIHNTKDMYKTGNTVTFKKNDTKEFFRNYTSNSFNEDELFDNLNSVYNDGFSNNRLDSLRIVTQYNGPKAPMFFNNKLTFEEILYSIPHNINKLASILKEGKCIVTIPKTTLLFIGMQINRMKKGSLSYGMFLTDYYGKYVNDLEFYNSLYIVLTCLMRSKEGYYNTLEIKGGNLVNGGFLNKIFGRTDAYLNNVESPSEYYVNDILGLEDMYLKWAKSTDEGGYQYFANAYYLIENIGDTNGYKMSLEKNGTIFKVKKGSKTYEGKGSLLYERFTGICNSFYDKELSGDDIKNHLNACYKAANSNYSSSTPFTDRYSNVYSLKDKVYLSFNENFSAYKHLVNFLTETKKVLIPYQLKPYEEDILESSRIKINSNDLTSAFNGFKAKLIDLYKNFDTETGQENKPSYENYGSNTLNNDNKYAMYRTLKNLYDKHLTDLPDVIDKYDVTQIGKNDTEYDRFHYVDSFYNDLGDELLINLEILSNLIGEVIDGYSNGDGFVSVEMSVYSFMSKLCQTHNMMLMCVPVFNGSFKGDCAKNLADMFLPKSFNDTLNETPLKGPSYICFYPHQTSQHLDIHDSEYENDGFNIINDLDLNATGEFTGPLQIPDLEKKGDDDYTIPSFGVEYGSQKQSIFKSINVNMDNPQTTEVAVTNMFKLANKNNEDMTNLSFNGQDLFKIYSNYAYTCQVEMMGCAQIQPLMYFQLNNIPLFRGAYMIINVEHDITPGNMTTTFKGVRLNRTKVPMTKTCVSVIDMDKLISGENTLARGIVGRKIDLSNVPFADTSVGEMGSDIDVTYESIKEKFPNNFYSAEGQAKAFNRLNPGLRKLMYCIVKDLANEDNKAKYFNNENLGIYITSSTRDAAVNGNQSSDHFVNGTPSKRRTELKATVTNGIDASGNTIYVDKSYKELGCAIDFHATKDGKIDREDSSIKVFNHIANNYTDYIRQLIWETKGDSPEPNGITNCIHLASYGRYGDNGSDKKQIYLATTGSGFSGTKTGSKNLAIGFLQVLESLFNNNRFDGTLYLNNYGATNPPIDDIRKILSSVKSA